MRWGRLWEEQAWREIGLGLGNAEFDACRTSAWRTGSWILMVGVQRSGQEMGILGSEIT